MSKKRKLVVNDEIVLKELGLEDVETIFETIDTERSYLEEWLPFVEKTLENSYTRSYVEGYLKYGRLDFTCTVNYKNRFVGIIGFKETDPYNKKTEIGYWLSEPFQHKGIITLSCKAMINYAFNEMELNRVQLKAAKGNLKSQHVAERIGFTFEGVERESELHSRGFVDLLVYSLLKADR